MTTDRTPRVDEIYNDLNASCRAVHAYSPSHSSCAHFGLRVITQSASSNAKVAREDTHWGCPCSQSIRRIPPGVQIDEERLGLGIRSERDVAFRAETLGHVRVLEFERTGICCNESDQATGPFCVTSHHHLPHHLHHLQILA